MEAEYAVAFSLDTRDGSPCCPSLIRAHVDKSEPTARLSLSLVARLGYALFIKQTRLQLAGIERRLRCFKIIPFMHSSDRANVLAHSSDRTGVNVGVHKREAWSADSSADYSDSAK